MRSNKFFTCLAYKFIFQKVGNWRRASAILDLVLHKREELVNKVETLGTSQLNVNIDNFGCKWPFLLDIHYALKNLFSGRSCLRQRRGQHLLPWDKRPPAKASEVVMLVPLFLLGQVWNTNGDLQLVCWWSPSGSVFASTTLQLSVKAISSRPHC